MEITKEQEIEAKRIARLAACDYDEREDEAVKNITAMLKEQDKITRHRCARAVTRLQAASLNGAQFIEQTAANIACMNT